MHRSLILCAALICGLAAFWLSQREPVAMAEALVPEPPPQAEVLVAAAQIGPGQPLDASLTRWQSWPVEALPTGVMTRDSAPDASAALQGHVARSSFVAGEPIRMDKLAGPGSGFLAAILPSGRRAVAVRISAENTAGGFILPDDHVDVIHSVSRAGPDGSSGGAVSRTILRNVRVLAIDQAVPEDGSQSPTALGKTATLELTPQQAEIIAAAELSGALSLALRAASDSGLAQVEPDEPQDETQPEPVAAPPKDRQILLIRSGQSEYLTSRIAGGGT
ncbi:Flp pilus assembly protein CpaB [Halodurantibacterium flavum]|uniref:Flp pilus assembly protein CpaB n=1 Tax=Halodurantibacterium flavum TaxID=1382802 RepID=A0ABW4S7G2_9RHOB